MVRTSGDVDVHAHGIVDVDSAGGVVEPITHEDRYRVGKALSAVSGLDQHLARAPVIHVVPVAPDHINVSVSVYKREGKLSCPVSTEEVRITDDKGVLPIPSPIGGAHEHDPGGVGETGPGQVYVSVTGAAGPVDRHELFILQVICIRTENHIRPQPTGSVVGGLPDGEVAEPVAALVIHGQRIEVPQPVTGDAGVGIPKEVPA